jgi:hypothetical protein
MTLAIINDCRDFNAAGRQQVRVQEIFGAQPAFIGVASDLEAAGHLVDILDAAGDKPSVIMVNIAPRDGKAKKWPNGTPFGYFYLGKHLVVTTVDGLTLSLVKKFGLVDAVHVFDTTSIVNEMIKDAFISKNVREHIINTQFRSYELLPRAAAFILKKKKVKPFETIEKNSIPDAPHAIWFVDNFGNCKTTLLPNDIQFEPGKTIRLGIGKIPMYNRLKDVPNHKPGLIIGSSGFGSQRFIEVVVQGKSAARFFKLEVGSEVM